MTGTSSKEMAFNPYKNYKFRVQWKGKTVAGFNKATGSLSHQTGYEPFTLERGITHDVEFEQWANKISQSLDRLGQKKPRVALRRTLVLEMYNEAGQSINAFILRHCWPSEYQALPELDAEGNAVAIELIKLAYGGQELD